ncbi:hypothetical protein JZ751_001118 [Albula glossodonta]|uniref:Uncharacterized protein n=1 Tax=Albula glossodonta TaxID=121402 RepID=A0A8T2PSV6_9TELE|nr:hypothetical protein JZ751_001118 [Albula glossodonta]
MDPQVTSVACGPSKEAPNSQNLIWSVLLGEHMSPEDLVVNISTNRLFSHGEGLYPPDAEPLDLDYTNVEYSTPYTFNGSLQEFTMGRIHNDSGDLLFQNRTVLPSLRSSNRTNRTRYI